MNNTYLNNPSVVNNHPNQTQGIHPHSNSQPSNPRISFLGMLEPNESRFVNQASTGSRKRKQREEEKEKNPKPKLHKSNKYQQPNALLKMAEEAAIQYNKEKNQEDKQSKDSEISIILYNLATAILEANASNTSNTSAVTFSQSNVGETVSINVRGTIPLRPSPALPPPNSTTEADQPANHLTRCEIEVLAQNIFEYQKICNEKLDVTPAQLSRIYSIHVKNYMNDNGFIKAKTFRWPGRVPFTQLDLHKIGDFQLAIILLEKFNYSRDVLNKMSTEELKNAVQNLQKRLIVEDIKNMFLTCENCKKKNLKAHSVENIPDSLQKSGI